LAQKHLVVSKLQAEEGVHQVIVSHLEDLVDQELEEAAFEVD
jgi:hypothetical protein